MISGKGGCTRSAGELSTAARGSRFPFEGPGELHHQALREVATLGDLPLLGLLDDHRGNEAVDRGVVREHADDVVATFDLTVQALDQVGRPQVPPVRDWEGREAKQVLAGVTERRGDIGNWRPSVSAMLLNCLVTACGPG